MSSRKRRIEREANEENALWRLTETDLFDRLRHSFFSGQREAVLESPINFDDLDQSSIHFVKADESFFDTRETSDNTLFLKSLLNATVKPYIPKYFMQGRDEDYLVDDYKSRVFNVLNEGRGTSAGKKGLLQPEITLEDLTRECLTRVDPLFITGDFSLGSFLGRFFKPQSAVSHVSSYFMDLLDQIDSALIFNNMSKFNALIASIENFDALEVRLAAALEVKGRCRAAAKRLTGELLPQRLQLIRLQRKAKNSRELLTLLKAVCALQCVQRGNLPAAALFTHCRSLIAEAGYPSRDAMEGIKCMKVKSDEFCPGLSIQLRRCFASSFWSLLIGHEATTGRLFDVQRLDECYSALNFHLELGVFSFADFAKEIFEQVEYRNAVYDGYLKGCDPSSPSLAADVHRHLHKFTKSMLILCERARKFIKAFNKKILFESLQNGKGFDFVLKFKSVLQNFFIFLGNLLKEIVLQVEEFAHANNFCKIKASVVLEFMGALGAAKLYCNKIFQRLQPSTSFLYLSRAYQRRYADLFEEMVKKLNTKAVLDLVEEAGKRLLDSYAQSITEAFEAGSFRTFSSSATQQEVASLLFPDASALSITFHPRNVVEISDGTDSFSYFDKGTAKTLLALAAHCRWMARKFPQQQGCFQATLHSAITSAASLEVSGSPATMAEQMNVLEVSQRLFTALSNSPLLADPAGNTQLKAFIERQQSKAIHALQHLVAQRLEVPLAAYKEGVQAAFQAASPFSSPTQQAKELSAALRAIVAPLGAARDRRLNRVLARLLRQGVEDFALQALEANNKLFRNRAAVGAEKMLLNEVVERLTAE